MRACVCLRVCEKERWGKRKGETAACFTAKIHVAPGHEFF